MYIEGIEWGFPGGSDDKESAYIAGDPGSILESRGSLEKGMVTHAVFLPRKSHGQRSLADLVHEVIKSGVE